MKKLLLTGSTGLIGSHILSYISTHDISEGIEVFTPYGEIPNIDFDYIIHAAGYAQPAKFLANEINTIAVNTTMLMKCLTKLKHDGRLLFLSSSEVYSGLPPPQNEAQIGTTTPTHPRAAYIEGKRCGEAICMAYRRLGYDVKIARLSLAYGMTQIGDTRAINNFVEQSLTTGKIHLMDRGEVKRTYLYVEDAVEILLDILFKGKSDIYNVGGTSTMTILALATKIGELTGAEVILGNRGLTGAPDSVQLNISKVLDEFGPREFTSLEAGLTKMIYDFRSLS